MRSIIHELDFTFLAIAETKLNESHPNAQFQIDGYNNLQDFRRDKTYNNGGGLLVYIAGLIIRIFGIVTLLKLSLPLADFFRYRENRYHESFSLP